MALFKIPQEDSWMKSKIGSRDNFRNMFHNQRSERSPQDPIASDVKDGAHFHPREDYQTTIHVKYLREA